MQQLVNKMDSENANKDQEMNSSPRDEVHHDEYFNMLEATEQGPIDSAQQPIPDEQQHQESKGVIDV